MSSLRVQTISVLILAVQCANSAPDLKFAKATPGLDSSAQFRSVTLPKIFGGRQVGQIKSNPAGPYGQQRQRYYKPTSRPRPLAQADCAAPDCALSPMGKYLTSGQRMRLAQVAKEARKIGLSQGDIRNVMVEQVRKSLDPATFKKFQRENETFEKRFNSSRRVLSRQGRVKREDNLEAAIKRVLKKKPKRHVISSKLHLETVENKAAPAIPLHRLPVV